MDYYVEVLSNTEDGEQIVATFRYANGKVTAEAQEGFEATIPEIMSMPMYDPEVGDAVELSDDPEAWIQLIPQTIRNTYMWARLVV